MTYKELFDSNGIFANVFKTDYADLYNTIFGATDAEQIDNFCVIKFGNKILLDCVTADSYKTLVNSIIALNAKRWSNVAEVLGLKYDVLSPEVYTTETTSTTETTTSDTNTNTNSKKVFNDEQFNEGEKEQNETSGKRTDNKHNKSSRQGYTANTLYSSIIQKEKELRNEDLAQQVINDIVAAITLDIY